MAVFIDPRVDFVFKLLVGNPDHPNITVHFLNAVLRPPTPIVSVVVLNPLQDRERSEDKLVVLDVLAQDAAGRVFNVEMQIQLPADMPKRLVFYNCVNLFRQLSKGESYARLEPAISICVLDRVLFPEVPTKYHLSFRLRCDQRKSLTFSDVLEFHTLELPKFVLPDDNMVKRLSPLGKWMYFLKEAGNRDAWELAALLGAPIFFEAAEVLEMIAQTPEELQFYEARLKFLHDQESRIDAARAEGFDEGREEGFEEGSLIGKIQLLQQLLGAPESTKAELQQNDEGALLNLVADLQGRLNARD